MRGQNGITIVALIITIIIMLILAGVVIKGITQENGIIKETNEAVILSSLKEVDAALEQYSISKAGEKAKQGDYAGKISLEELISEGILKKVEVEDTLRTIGVITDLDKIGIQGKLGKKGKSIEKEKIGSLSEIKDVYAIDCEDNMLYYIKGNVWNLEGMKEIAKLNEREAQKRKFITRWEVTEENKIIELPLRKEKWSSYYRYDCKIEVIDSNGELEKEINIKDHIKELDENDQTQSIKMDYDAFEAARTIECKSVGRYEIRISGLCEEFNFSKKATSKDVIQEIVSFGEVGIKVLDLTGATNITSIPEPTDKSFKEAINISFAQTQISKIPNNLLASATNLEQVSFAYTKIEEIPADLLKNNINLTSVANIFKETNIKSIPENLFDSNIKLTLMNGAFSNTKITNIPEKLFENNTEITSFNDIFAECRELKEIPENLFKSNTKVISFEATFRNTGITKIPETLFANNTEVLYFGDSGSVGWGGTFLGCAGITEIPENLFVSNTKVERFEGVFRGTSIQEVPENLFANNTKVKSFTAAFLSTPLTKIPENLFKNNTEVTSMTHVFAYDSKIKEIPVNLFKNNTKVTNFYAIFIGCQGITEIPESLFESNIEVTSFSRSFEGCRSLTTITNGLFDKNIKVTTFEGCFKTCVALTELPQGLFAGKETANTKSLFLNTKVTEETMANAGLTAEQIANAQI